MWPYSVAETANDAFMGEADLHCFDISSLIDSDLMLAAELTQTLADPASNVSSSASTPWPPSSTVLPPPACFVGPRGMPARSKSRRGKHIAGKPELLHHARTAHILWMERVLAVRSEPSPEPGFRARLGRWTDRAAMRAGGKLQSLLRTLHCSLSTGTVRLKGPGLRPAHSKSHVAVA
jgi:hypothetical protein